MNNISKGLIAGIVMFLSVGGFSQNKSDVDFVKEELGLEKRVIIERFVKPDKEHKAAFDKVYAEYEAEQKELSAEKFKLLHIYAETWETMSNEEANSWTLRTLELGKKRNELLEKYFLKIKEVTDAKLATQFIQVELYALSAVRNTIFKNMPFVGDDDVQKNK